MLNEAIVSEIATKLGMPEVLVQFLKSDAPADGVNPFADQLGLVEAFTTEQLTVRLSNERQIAATEATKTATGNTYGAIDTRTLKATGIPKNQGETTVDYTERAFKEKFGLPANEPAEIQRLRDDLAAKDALLGQKETAFKEMEVAHATERKQGQINGVLDSAINGLPISTTPEMLDSQREFVKFRLNQAYTADVVDGKVQYTDRASGQVVRDAKTAAPITTAALVEQFAPKVVSLKKTSAAQGSGFDSSRTVSTADGNTAFDFALYATKGELAAAINKAGIGSGTPEGATIYAAFLKARPDAK